MGLSAAKIRASQSALHVSGNRSIFKCVKTITFIPFDVAQHQFYEKQMDHPVDARLGGGHRT